MHYWKKFRKSSFVFLFLLAAWFILCVGDRPSRLLYLCQRIFLQTASSYAQSTSISFLSGVGFFFSDNPSGGITTTRNWFSYDQTIQGYPITLNSSVLICGDETCNGNEDCSTCSQDCGVCSTPGDLNNDNVVNVNDLLSVSTFSDLVLVGRNFGNTY